MTKPHASTSGTWRLGDRTVHRIGFGAKRLPPNQDDAVTVLRRAVELGVNHIDTAAFYPTHDEVDQRWANAWIRRALAPYPADLVIATKVGPGYDEAGEWHHLVRPDQLRAQVEENLRDLGRDHLDVVNLRQYGLDTVDDHFGALADLRDAGLICHLGLSNVRAPHVAQARAIAPVVCVQNRYGVDFGRVNDGLVNVCGDQGIAFVPFFALAASGREAGGVADNPAVLSVARRRGATPAQVRIAWTLGRGAHVLAIPGTGRAEHLAENVAAGDLRLSPEDLAAIDAGPVPAT